MQNGRVRSVSLIYLALFGVTLAAFSCHPLQNGVTFGVIKNPSLLGTWIPLNYGEICIPKSRSTDCHIPTCSPKTVSTPEEASTGQEIGLFPVNYQMLIRR